MDRMDDLLCPDWFQKMLSEASLEPSGFSVLDWLPYAGNFVSGHLVVYRRTSSLDETGVREKSRALIVVFVRKSMNLKYSRRYSRLCLFVVIRDIWVLSFCPSI